MRRNSYRSINQSALPIVLLNKESDIVIDNLNNTDNDIDRDLINDYFKDFIENIIVIL